MSLFRYYVISLLSVATQLIDYRHQETQGNESTWRQHEEQDVIGLRHQGEAKDAASTQQLTADAEQRQAEREAQTNADAIEERGHRRVLGSKRLCATENDTVHHNERNKQAESRVNVGQVCLDDQLKDSNESRNNYNEYGFRA